MKSWRALQASHRLEGPPYLRRNFNPHFMTPENRWANQARHACVGAMINKLVGGLSRPYTSTASRDRFTEGDKMSLLGMMVEEVRALNLNGFDRRMGWVCEWIYYPKEPVLSLNSVSWCLLLTVLCGMSQEEVECFGREINTVSCSNFTPPPPASSGTTWGWWGEICYKCLY